MAADVGHGKDGRYPVAGDAVGGHLHLSLILYWIGHLSMERHQ